MVYTLSFPMECPRCGFRFGEVGAVDNGPPPKSGDLVLCQQCGTWGCVKDNKQLRVARQQEKSETHYSDIKAAEEALRAQQNYAPGGRWLKFDERAEG